MRSIALIFFICLQWPAYSSSTFTKLTEEVLNGGVIDQTILVELIDSSRGRKSDEPKPVLELYKVQDMDFTNFKIDAFKKADDEAGEYKYFKGAHVKSGKPLVATVDENEGYKGKMEDDFLTHKLCLLPISEEASRATCGDKKKISVKPMILASILPEELAGEEIKIEFDQADISFVNQEDDSKKINASLKMFCGRTTSKNECTGDIWPGLDSKNNLFKFTLSKKTGETWDKIGHRTVFLIFNISKISSTSAILTPGEYIASYQVSFIPSSN